MADKNYEVISDKFTGKHRVYQKGDVIAESEIMKNCDIKVCLNGQKGLKVKRGHKEVVLPDVERSLKDTSAKPSRKKAAK